MKFLCLHGMGTTSDILRSQLGSILCELEDAGHEFVFVDGEIECDTSEEISSCYPPPYLCYYPLPTPDFVRAAQDYVMEIIEEEGPFEGFIGFSQGAALGASLMLQHAKSNPVDDLFQMAIFIGASLPFNVDNEQGLQNWMSAKSRDQIEAGEYSVGELSLGFPSSEWKQAPTLLGRYHPVRDPRARIMQPTIHIIGAQDEYASQAHTLTKLCRYPPTVVNHDGGHRVPRDAATTNKAQREIERVITMVSLRHG